jgi:hypothetical protein
VVLGKDGDEQLTDLVISEALQRANEDWNILQTVNRRKAN